MDERRESAVRRLGLVVHPARPVDRVLERIRAWASDGVTVGQVRIPGQTRRLADPVDPAACDMLIALGGDGTALAALHAGAPTSCPVLGVACGSVGALTSASADRIAWALEQIDAGRWDRKLIPALDVEWDDGHAEVAINDLVVVRDGAGQVMVSIVEDEVLYARVAGDGLVVATQLGSSAYNMAAGGPLLAPGAEAMAITPLAAHGGSCPSLVADSSSRLTLTIDPGYGGVRYEVDGQRTAAEGRVLTVSRRADYATLVTLAEEEPWLTGLRRRGLVLDGPRVLVRDTRSEGD